MNDMLASESGSGCESGWTLYLEHSYLSPYPSHRGNEFTEEKRAKDEEEDLSMVSDASSGPPHFHDDDDDADDNNGCFYHAPINATLLKKSGKRQKINEKRLRKVEEQLPFLDDTASSPIFNLSNNNLTLTNNQASMENVLDFSQSHSNTHFEGKTAFQDHFGFFQSSVSGTQLQQNQWFERKRVGMR